MPISNEDIISSLVAYYKRSGVDMTALLGDPTWQAMKVYDKIEAIKKYAHDIHAGSTDELTSGEKRTIASNSMMNMWPVLPAALALAQKGYSRGLIPGVKPATIIGLGLSGAAIGLGVGAIQAYVQAKQTQDYRQALRNNLENVIRDPSNINAVGVLASDNIRRQRFSLRDAVAARIQKELAEIGDPTEYMHENYMDSLKAKDRYVAAQRGVPSIFGDEPSN